MYLKFVMGQRPRKCTASQDELWTGAKEYWGSEEKLDEAMQTIYEVAIQWNFKNNYQYKTVTNATFSSGHENHFHIGHK